MNDDEPATAGMPQADVMARLRVVLVGPQHPGNIGAAARAMKVMGLSDLVLVAPERYPDAEPVPQTILLNPVITPTSSEIEDGWEGCLSVPEVFEDVERAERITVRYLDRDGQARQMDADGLLAVCVQHEIDHLDGVLFVDHLSALKRNMILRRLAKELKQKAAG